MTLSTSAHMLRRGRGVRKSSRRDFSDAHDVEVLRQSTTDRKLVAARLGVSRAVVDKALENERRPWVTVARIWLAANLEARSPEALAPLEYLRDYCEDLTARDGGHGDPEDVLREGAGVLSTCGAVCRRIAAVIRDGSVNDGERAELERLLRHHEEQIGQLRRETAAANDRWRARRAG